jgi:ATP-dependent DNA helicase PIF1
MFNSEKTQNDLMDKYRSMLEDYNEAEGLGMELVKLSDSQQRAVELFEEGKNLLILGSGGVGKSHLVKELKYRTSKSGGCKRMVITATTGIAAYNINGITINSFMGIGTGEHDIEVLIKRVRRKVGVRERLKSTDILVIDEISMASAGIFEKINAICQSIRRSSAAFGGIQVVLTGDLLQLLPVFNRNTALFPDQDTRLIFESPVFNRYFNEKNTVNLTLNFRQNDPKFVGTLLRFRRGVQTSDDIELLRTRLIGKLNPSQEEMESAVHLVASNKQAQVINLTALNGIGGEVFKFKSKFMEQGNTDICGELTKELQSQFNQKGISEVTLKIGARVMLIKNLAVEEGLVNGSVGTVIKFKGMDTGTSSQFPVVKFDNGVTRMISPVEWELELGSGAELSVSKATQLPLMLCWAITIHRSQSLTLEKAVMDLGECFCDGMVYVALSRVKSLDGLYLSSFNPGKVTVSEKTRVFLQQIKCIE